MNYFNYLKCEIIILFNFVYDTLNASYGHSHG